MKDSPVDNGDATFLSPNWVKETDAVAPPSALAASMAWDPAHHQMILFGGFDTTVSNGLEHLLLDQTWAWADGVWTRLSPTTTPPPVEAAAMAWDPELGKVVLFGGYADSGAGDAVTNDLWAWDGTDWLEVAPAGVKPSPRSWPSVAWDPDFGGLIVFGGEGSDDPEVKHLLNDTWLFKGGSWTELQAGGATGAPDYRAGQGLAYSESTHQLVMFGGTTATCPSCTATFSDDTWVFDGSSWIGINPSGAVPSPRTYVGMAYDPGLGGVVLYGGVSGTYDSGPFVADTDTWAWNGSRWLKATGVSGSELPVAAPMAATDSGQVLYVSGGDNEQTGDEATYTETWLYDTNVPLLSVDVAGADGPKDPYWTGESATVTVTAQNVGASTISPATITSTPTDVLLPGGSAVTWNGSPLGSVDNGTVTWPVPSMAPGATGTGVYHGTVLGSTRRCSLMQVPAVASNEYGGESPAYGPMKICGGGLGTEKWWTFDSTDLGSGASASVNVGNGNLVLKQSDATTIQSHGQLAFELGRAYNSQDNIDSPGPLGAGWQWDLSSGGDAGAPGLDVGGLLVPDLQSVTEPLAVTYVDRDGTRDVFKLRNQSLSLGLGGLLPSLGSLPFTVDDDSALCVDTSYSAPPGVDMYLYRYVRVGSSGCGVLGSGLATVGWSVVRPDRLRYDYDVTGKLLQVVDAAGNAIVYKYAAGKLQSIYSNRCRRAGDGGTNGADCPQYGFDYKTATVGGQAADRIDVTDPAGRVTSYIVLKADGDNPAELVQVWNPGDPYSTDTGATPSITYTYAFQMASGQCPDSTSDATTPDALCSATDPAGRKTTFGYTKAPVGPDRVLSVTDRRANETGGASAGAKTLYTYDDDNDTVAADTASATKVGDPDGASAPTGCVGQSSCERNFYQGIDDRGRVGEVDQGDAAGAVRRQEAFFWDGEAIASCEQPDGAVDNDLCETITRAVPSSDPFTPHGVQTATVNGVTVSDEAVAYKYDELGALVSTTKITDPSSGWDTSTAQVTTYGNHQQYIEAGGGVHVFDDRVLGSGEVESGNAASSTSYSSEVKADSPAAYYRLDNLTGSDADDSSGNGQSGAEDAGVLLAQPGALPGNTAIGEPASTWAAVVPHLSGFASGTGPSSAFTVETWQKTSGTALDFVACSPCSGTATLAAGRAAGGYPQLTLGTGTERLDVQASLSIADGEWHMVDYVYDGSGDADGAHIYVDGKAVDLTVNSDTLGTMSFRAADDPLRIGYSAAPAGTNDVDEVSLYATALNADRIGRHYGAVSKLSRVDDKTLYAISDRTQMLSPRGNAASSNWGNFLTAYRRDVPAAGASNYPAPNQTADTTVCGNGTVGNTGLLCETDTAAAAGVPAGVCTSPTAAGGGVPAGGPASTGHPHTCTSSVYDGGGQKTDAYSAKANAASPRGAATHYTYYEDAGSCTAQPESCDLSQSVSVGGQLKATTDPKGNSAVFAYDAAGNVARTWDRDATKGEGLDGDWTSAAAPPSRHFSETDHATPVTSSTISVSGVSTLVVEPDGTVRGSGDNAFGELGDGTTVSKPSPVSPAGGLHDVIQVGQSATGLWSAQTASVALTSTGKVYVWGDGATIPTPVPGLPAIASMSVGGGHVLALDREGGLWAFGKNSNGQIGNGSSGGSVTTPAKVLTGVSTFAAGGYHSLAVRTDGSLWAWGYNNYGQLGNGSTSGVTTPTKITGIGHVVSVSAGTVASYAIKSDGTVWAWGDNTAGALGTGSAAASATTPQQITTLGAGPGASGSAGRVRQLVGSVEGAAALLGDGTVWAWGLNNTGQLGGAQTGDADAPVKIPGVSDQVALAGGWGTYLSANAAGQTTMWGDTSAGQLGTGTTPPQSTPTGTGYDLSPFRTPWRYTTATRDAVGNQSLSIEDPTGNTVLSRPGRGTDVFTTAFDKMASYDADDNQIESVSPMQRGSGSSQAAQPVTSTYDAFGNNTVTVDANGYATVRHFDETNRLLDTQTTRGSPDDATGSGCTGNASGSPWTSKQQDHKVCVASSTYDGSDNPITVTDATGATSRTTFDGAGQKIAQAVPRNAGDYDDLTTRWNYDPDGNVLDTCPPRQFDSDHEDDTTSGCTATGGYSTHNHYDDAGLVTKTTVYRVTGPSAATAEDTTYGYDADGNVVSTTDANDHTTTTTYDLLDRRTTQSVPRAAGVSEKTTWDYDPSGNVTAVEAPGNLNLGNGSDGPLVVDGTTGADSTDGVLHDEAHPFEIPVGAQYTKVILQNGGWATSADAHGLVLSATGGLTVCVTCGLTMAGRGEAGGAGGSLGLGGQPGTAGDVSGGNGGAGGSTSLVGPGSGGGGGGHQTTGGEGNIYNSTPVTAGGASSGTTDFSDVGSDYLQGSGGGGGGGGQIVLGGKAGNGGAGGGFIHLSAAKITVHGIIDASGTVGTKGGPNAGGGGGGAGGGIWLTSPTVSLDSAGALAVDGGVGGSGGNAVATKGQGGDGSVGDVRIDADTVTNAPAGTDRTHSVAEMITAYSYDADNRVLDTVQGAQTLQADPDDDDSAQALPDPGGQFNLRTRQGYDADGNVAISLPAQAFSNAASLHRPDLASAVRTDYDLDGRAVAVYRPRYDTGTSGLGDVSAGSGGDAGTGTDQQTSQCPTGADPDVVADYAGYPSTVGVCVARSSYDGDGNLTRSYLPGGTSGNNRYASYTYTDDNLRLTAATADPTASSGSSSRTTREFYLYDGVGRLIRTTDANGHAQVTAYTADGLVASTTGESYDSVTHVVLNGYDANGDLVSSRAPDGADPASGLDADDYTTKTTWTSDGLQAQIRAPGLGHDDFDVTSYTYDAVGNPVTVKSPSGNAGDVTNPGGLVTRNTFTDDNLVATSAVPIASGSYRATAYTYTPSGQKAAADVGHCTTTSPKDCSPDDDPGDGSLWHEGRTTRYGYAPDGLNVEQIGADEAAITTSYDGGGRVASVTSTDNHIVVSASYYLDGLVRAVDDGDNANTYAYTGTGQTSVRTDHTAAGGLTDGATEVTSYAYGDADLPAVMSSDVTNGTSSWSYDVAGRPVSRTDVVSGSTVRSVVDAYHPDDSLASITVRPGDAGSSSVVGKDEYSYDDSGNITADVVSGSQSFTDGYSYDPAGNLTKFTHTGYADTVYGWDHDANRVSSTSGGESSSWSYRADDSVASAVPVSGSTVSYVYKASGELASTAAGGVSCSTYVYDDFGRTASQTQVKSDGCGTQDRVTVGYVYDGLDRVQRTTTGGSAEARTRFSYDGLSSALVGQKDAVNGADTDPTVLYQLNVDGSPTALAQFTAPGAASPVRVWLDKDGTGSVTTLLGSGDSSASCVVDYDPFGSPIGIGEDRQDDPNAVCASGSGKESTGNAVWYRSAVRDASYRTYQFGARTYDPSLGAFTTPDSRRVDTPADDLSVGTDPLTLNGYAYVNGNPVNLADLDGHRPAYVGGTDSLADSAAGVVEQVKAWVHATLEAEAHHQSGLSRGISAFFGGVGAEALDTARFLGTEALKLETNYYFTPQGIEENYQRAVGMLHAVTHPGQTASALWDKCAADGARCAGGLTFDLATLLVGGEGAAAKLGRGAEIAEDLGRIGAKTTGDLGEVLSGADQVAARMATRNEHGTIELQQTPTKMATEPGERGLYRERVPIQGTGGGPVEPSMSVVNDVASRAGVDLRGVNVSINSDLDLVGRQLYGHTPDAGNITLYPDAFSNEETLAMTLGHERNHIFQAGLYGLPTDSATLEEFERASYAVEPGYLSYFRAFGLGAMG